MVPSIPKELAAPLGRYLDLLERWNRVHALTSLPPEDRRTELLMDSCALLPHLARFPSGSRVVDLGTGMGIPAVVLALARPDLDIIAIDSARKKIAFLRQASLELGIRNLTALAQRFEAVGNLAADLGVAKALAPMDQLLGWWEGLGAAGSPFLALKGPEWRTEPGLPHWKLQGHPYDLPGRGHRWVVEATPQP